MKPVLTFAGMPVIGIAGWKNSGKTTLVVRVVEELCRRGRRVATVKHSHHDMDIDGSDADSARHRRAGACQSALVAPMRWAIIEELRGGPEPTLDDVCRRIDPCDIVLVEGYKSAPIRKIEARRTTAASREPLVSTDPFIIAIAADHDIAGSHVPVFHLDDISPLTDFLEREAGLTDPAAAVRKNARVGECGVVSESSPVA